MLFWAVAFSASVEFNTYLGNWTLAVNESHTSLDYGHVQLTIMPSSELHFPTGIPQVLEISGYFRNASMTKLFPESYFTFVGFSDSSNESTYCFRVTEDHDPNYLLGLIGNRLAKYPFFPPYLHEIHELLLRLFGNMTRRHDFMSLAFIIEKSPSSEPFDLPLFLNGTLLYDSYELQVNARGFDLGNYVSEGKLFGLLTSICLAVSFYAWSSFRLLGPTFLTRLSLHSYIMHAGFEFSYGLFLLSIGFSYIRFRSIYLLLFLANLVLYFGFQMTLIANIWKASNDLGELDMPEIRRRFLRFFGEIAFLLFSSLFAVLYMASFPYVPLLFLYSSFVPQIVHTLKYGQKKMGDSLFVVAITVYRMFVLLYLFAYRQNVVGSRSMAMAVLMGIYCMGQMIVIILQNLLGPDFFLPKRYRNPGFDYSQGIVEPDTECTICMSQIGEDDETMVTPCGHAFHKECLERWMQLQMRCPTDRSPLPEPA
jgi:hypothetical protein